MSKSAISGNTVTSVNSKKGNVVLNQDDIASGETYVQTENNYSDTDKGNVASNTTHRGASDNPHNVTAAQVGASPTNHNHAGTYEPANSNIQEHISSTSNPHGVSKSDVGLGSVNNTADADKPVSTAQQTEFNKRATYIERALAVVTNNIELDYDSRINLASNNRVSIGANVTISEANATNARFATFKVNVTGAYTLTFPAGSISPDPNWSAGVWTPPETGKFTISMYRTGTEIEVIFTQNAAV